MRLAFQPNDITKDKVEVYLHGKAEVIYYITAEGSLKNKCYSNNTQLYTLHITHNIIMIHTN